ncbi:hypothetical protein ACWF99_12115 [Nocardia sp. NPDC055002]
MAAFEDLRARLQRVDGQYAADRRTARSALLRAAGSTDEELHAAAAAAKERAEATARQRATAFDSFEAFTDPRHIAALTETTPLLLLPVRLETRFFTEGNTPELRVRIYPDECSVDSFDPELSTTEVAAAARFWREYWAAGGVEAQERAAFATLCGSYGTGRAKWLVKAFVPVNPGDKPDEKNPATDTVFIVSDTELPARAIRRALSRYWQAVWKAADDVAAIASARATLDDDIANPATATQLVERYIPFNLADPPPPGVDRTGTTVTVAWLELPDEQGEEHSGWRRAPIAAALPERFVVLCSSGTATRSVLGKPITEPLYVGPDPAAPDADRIVPQDGKLSIPAPLQWMFGFEAAEAAGMGIRVPLTAAEANDGFDRIVVVGLRMRADPEAGQAALEELFTGHAFSRSGFELLPQGVPTNNTDHAPSAWSRRDDPDLAFDEAFGPAKFQIQTDPAARRDGQVLADCLGLNPARMRRVRGADGCDSIEARLMNTALAPGTLGYLTGVLMSPVFEGWTSELSWFFSNYVSGRGAVPAIRIGAQPYGIVASTAFSRIAWLGSDDIIGTFLPDRRTRFLRRLHAVLGVLHDTWTQGVGDVARVGDGSDPHKTLLDILGLHPNSAEFHYRPAKSLDELSRRSIFTGILQQPAERYRAAQQRQNALIMLRFMGYTGEEPDLLDLFFRTGHIKLKGPLVTEQISETEPLPAVTADDRNALRWLADTAGISLDRLRRQEGFLGDAPPRTLLYIMAHFALTRGYLDASDRMRYASGLFTQAQMRTIVREPKSVHLDTVEHSESTWQRLYEADNRLTGRPGISIADHLTSVLPSRPDYAADLDDQIKAIQGLVQTPTAHLERLLTEHVDLVSYRIDAWRLGIVARQLEHMRNIGTEQPRRGVYLGAYGWLENVRPDPKRLSAPDLSDELAAAFAEGPPLQVDPANGGHLHAPSLNQAVTAAILRAGELANRTAGTPNAFSINLTSTRVRTALALLDGVRSGQHLGALLGYRFERALHDAGGFVELDALVFAFRRAFPLTAEKLTPTESPPPPETEAVEARNVVDGLALVKQAGTGVYPYGKPLPPLGATERGVVERAVADLVNAFDAMADLILAEGVHQASQNNQDRAASHLDIAADFTAPPDPAVVTTPDRGFALTCRAGLELDPGASASASAPPRSKAQPALDTWLTAALPPLGSIACTVTWQVAGASEQTRIVRLGDLGVAPIDVINLIADEGGAGLAELDDRVRKQVVDIVNPRPDARLRIRYSDAPAGELSVFIVSAFVRRLRGIALRSRPLRAGDVALPSAAQRADAVPHLVDRSRVADVVADLSMLRTDLDSAIAAGAALLTDPVANRAALLDEVDDRIATVVDLLAEAARFGGARIGWGSVYDWRGERFEALLTQVTGLLARWAERATAAARALDREAALPSTATSEERLRLLRAAEGQVSTAVAAELDPVTLRPVVEAKVAAFLAKSDSIRTSAVDPLDPGLADRLGRCIAVLPIDAFDPEPIGFTEIEDSILTYWSDLQTLLSALRKDLTARFRAATAALDDHDTALDAEARLGALQRGAEAVFGEGFQLIPTFTLAPEAAAEQTQAHAHFLSGGLLQHATTTLEGADPLDTWLYGCARVRPMLRLLEDTLMLAEAHGRGVGELSAMQLPHKPGAPLLALDFPRAHAPDGERLSYVALVRAGFTPAAARCGLLLDDWSETIPAIEPDEPGPQHTTGVAFHFDRPSQEPPQAMLLLTPATWNGAWSWDDIVTGITDTFALARIRAVEPAQLDDTTLAQFLPATVATVAVSGLVMAANFALVNTDVRIVRSTGDG